MINFNEHPITFQRFVQCRRILQKISIFVSRSQLLPTFNRFTVKCINELMLLLLFFVIVIFLFFSTVSHLYVYKFVSGCGFIVKTVDWLSKVEPTEAYWSCMILQWQKF